MTPSEKYALVLLCTKVDNRMEIGFAGKKALVTGAGKGIGREICKALVKGGAEVYAVSRTQSDLDSLVTEVPGIHPICLDLQDIDACVGAVSKLQGIQLLVNNAGFVVLESFLDVTKEAYDQIMDINVKAVLFLSQAVAKNMIASELGGSIVNISSQASKVALKDHTVYCASKGALDQLTRSMAQELGPYNIRTNALNPTVVWTEMGKKAWSDPQKSASMLSKIPLGRFAEMKDVVNATLYLLSDKSDMINGTTLPIDGGFLATH
ncbi:L-xylulose reductase-like [Rhopilema esculentum]|uniref:L-xylulose reductase-like n=1 Tax=Rhopilema esculentum TaxID=499914 RepID=UPI0031D44170|eukprot:gene9160-16828_t